jgi:hypothetical protein
MLINFKNKNMEPKNIEFWEYHYLEQMEFMLVQDLGKMLEGLKSKDKIKKDWFEAFKKSADKNSDFARGAERIYFWLFNTFGIPNSAPIGADMFFETYNAFIHIDIKTAKIDNPSDYRGKIPLGSNQTSYKSPNKKYNVNLPSEYSFKKKICLTYFIEIIYEIVKDNIEIKAIILISVPNGKLYKTYGDDIISASKNKGKGFRYSYSKNHYFKLLNNKYSRVRMIYAEPDTKEFKKRITGFDIK